MRYNLVIIISSVFGGFAILVASLFYIPLALMSYSDHQNQMKFKEEYGTIQKLLDKNTEGKYYWVDKKTGGGSYQEWKTRCYDVDNKLYNALYSLEYREVEFGEGPKKPNDVFIYHVPFDDGAYICIYDNGAGYMGVFPDGLTYSSLYVYFVIDREVAEELVNLANSMLEAHTNSNNN